MFRLPAVAVLLYAVAALLPATAAKVYKCTAADGSVAFQNTFCDGGQESRAVQFAPEPPRSAQSSDDDAKADRPARRGKASSSGSRGSSSTSAGARGKAAAKPRKAKRPRRNAAPAAAGADQSWECRVGNGEVFYQHSPCPSGAIAATEQRDKSTRGRSAGAARLTPISGRPIPRREACRRIHAASASSRPGHERDEDVSTYERNLGRDPCR